jgi:hypothetical protein
MIEKYVMSENDIPDGILHDQNLCNVIFEDNVLTLSFDIKYFDEYDDSEFAQKYKDFTKCHIKCKLKDEYFCSVMLETSLNKKLEGRSKEISIIEFVKMVNEYLTSDSKNMLQYLYTYTSPGTNSAIIELSTCEIKYKRKMYSTCVLNLSTEQIEYIWE